MEMNVLAVCIMAKDLGSVLSRDNTRRVAVPYQLLLLRLSSLLRQIVDYGVCVL